MSMFENDKNVNEMNASESYKMERDILGIRSECGADYVLPDYMGDVRRLLRCTACVCPCNKFVSEGELSFLSDVTFKIMYLDSENTLTEASFGADFEHTEKISESVTDAGVNTRVHNVTVRLGGPRKISAKASLVTDISLADEGKIMTEESFGNATCKTERVKIHSSEYRKCAEREYAEELERLEDLLADEVDVVKYDAEAYIDSVHRTDNGVNLSGCINAYCILKVADDLMRVEKSIPVEEHLEIEDVDGDSFFLAECYVTGVNLNINNTPEDKDGNIYLSVVMNMTLECEAEHHKNREYELVSDAFREGEDNVCSYESFNYNELAGTACERRRISLAVNRGEENIHDILEKSGAVKNVKCELRDGELSVQGDLSISLVARGAGNGECFPIKIDEVINERIKLPGVTESSKIRLNVMPCEISPAFDSEKIYADCDIIIEALAKNAKSVKILSELSSSKKNEENCRRITVYYPEKGDTLWSVSKKYAVSPEKIALANMLSGEKEGCGCDLSDKTKIVIP